MHRVVCGSVGCFTSVCLEVMEREENKNLYTGAEIESWEFRKCWKNFIWAWFGAITGKSRDQCLFYDGDVHRCVFFGGDVCLYKR